MANLQWEFGASGSGLHFTIVYDEALQQFQVTSLEGSFDLNALWWSDGDPTANEGSYTLTKSESSLNMNGANTVFDNDGNATSEKIAWDDYQNLSLPGLGSDGTEKDTYISDGETATFAASPAFLAFLAAATLAGDEVTLGVRATSVNGDGSIKFADEHACEASVSTGDPLFFDSFEYQQGNLDDNGWTGTPHSLGTEIHGDGHGGVTSADPIGGNQWLDTQATPGPIDLSHSVIDANGGEAQITISLAMQQHSNFTATGALDVYWNGAVVESIDLSDLGNVYNTFDDFSVVVDSNVGANTLRIVDTGVPTNVGFAVDYVNVQDYGFFC